jgi:hypothetical protein
MGKKDQLVQIFLNLAKNAAEAIHQGGEAGEIHITTAFRPGIRLTVPGTSERITLPFEVCVHDTGPGVPEELRPNIFDPFVTTKPGGKGLGLALVAKIVRDHGGIIECLGRERGTTFRVLLRDFDDELSDPVVRRHLDAMYDQLIEGHLLRLVKPYSRVQIDYLSQSINLPNDEVESRLSQMILDKKLDGIVDQQDRCVVLFAERHPVELYSATLNAIEGFDKLVDVLFEKVAGKFDKSEAEEAEEKKKKQEREERKKQEEEAGKKK